MTADTVGGVWTYALDLVRALAGISSGGQVPHPGEFQVMLATMGAPVRPEQRAEAALIPNLTLRESAFKLEWMDDPWDDIERAREWLLALEREFAPDIVHLNGYAHGSLPFRAPALAVAHSCVLSWWQAVLGEDAPSAWDCYRSRVTAGLRGADRVVAPTYAMLDSVRAHYGDIDGAVIYNGRDPNLYIPRAKEPMVLTAGRLWDDAKNVGALVEIAPQLPAPVCVAGDCDAPDGGGRRELTNVQPLGRLTPPALAGWMGRAAIYALPARYEPFGLSALEAALCGCALVLGDIPSLREVWGDTALFVPPGDPAELLRALRSLLDDPARREALAERSRERAWRYTAERMAAGYAGVYREMLA